eukprot:Skav204784  [mRNA]  locus=scaffold763:199240:199815:- [translate_table: standard]
MSHRASNKSLAFSKQCGFEHDHTAKFARGCGLITPVHGGLTSAPSPMSFATTSVGAPLTHARAKGEICIGPAVLFTSAPYFINNSTSRTVLQAPKGENPNWSTWWTFALHLTNCSMTSGVLQQSSRAKSNGERPFWRISTLILAFTFLLNSKPADAKYSIIPTSHDKIAHSTGPMPLIFLADSSESKANSR